MMRDPSPNQAVYADGTSRKGHSAAKPRSRNQSRKRSGSDRIMGFYWSKHSTKNGKPHAKGAKAAKKKGSREIRGAVAPSFLATFADFA